MELLKVYYMYIFVHMYMYNQLGEGKWLLWLLLINLCSYIKRETKSQQHSKKKPSQLGSMFLKRKSEQPNHVWADWWRFAHNAILNSSGHKRSEGELGWFKFEMKMFINSWFLSLFQELFNRVQPKFSLHLIYYTVHCYVLSTYIAY